MLIPDELAFAANLSILFPDLPPLQRPAAAAAAGFGAVESWWPFATATPAPAEVDAFVAALEGAGVQLVALNLLAGDMAAGERGLVSVPGRGAEFQASLRALVGIAERTGCRAFNALYGQRVAGVDPAAQDRLAVENLAAAAAAVAPLGGVVLVEPLTRGENGAYPLCTAADAVGVVRRVRAQAGAANLRWLADLYHLASNGEELAVVLPRHADEIGHVQVADVPGRHQPGTGSLDIEGLLALLASSGYRGFVGLEYRPLGPSERCFDWLPVPRRAAPGPGGGGGR